MHIQYNSVGSYYKPYTFTHNIGNVYITIYLYTIHVYMSICIYTLNTSKKFETRRKTKSIRPRCPVFRMYLIN